MSTSEGSDLKKLMKELLSPPADHPVLVEVPPIQYLMVDGAGDPNTSQEYAGSMQALYGVFYTMKFARKKRGETPDLPGMPLEGLWWTADMDVFGVQDKSAWDWTSMMAVPDFVNAEMVREAAEQLAAKRGAVPMLDRLRLERLGEGLCAQIMHLGAYSEEPPTIEKLHAFIAQEGYVRRGRHHEIYISDPRRTKPERIKTVIRQPVTPA